MSHSIQRQMLLSNLYRQYQDSVLCDVVIKCGTVNIRCHKNVLSASSCFFHHKIVDEKLNEICVPEYNVEVVRQVIQFFYTGVYSIQMDTVYQMMVVSHEWKVDALYGEAVRFIRSHFTINNIDAFLQLADDQGNEELFRSASRYFRGNVMTIESINRLKFNVVDITFEHNEFNVPDEDKICELLLDWVKCNDPEIGERGKSVLSNIRIDHLSRLYLNRLKFEDCLTDIRSIQKHIRLAETFQKTGEKHGKYKEKRYWIQKPDDRLPPYRSVSQEHDDSSNASISRQASSNSSMASGDPPDLLQATYLHSREPLEQDAYEHLSNQVQLPLPPDHDEYATSAAATVPEHASTAPPSDALKQPTIYLSKQIPSNVTFPLPPRQAGAANGGSQAPLLPHAWQPRTAQNGHVLSERQPSVDARPARAHKSTSRRPLQSRNISVLCILAADKRFYEYSDAHRQWTYVSEGPGKADTSTMSFHRYHAGVIALDQNRKKRTVVAYNLFTKQQLVLPSDQDNPTRLRGVSLTAIGDMFFAIGGENDEKMSPYVYQTTDSLSEWTKVTYLIKPVRDAIVVTHQDMIYIFGGNSMQSGENFINTTQIYNAKKNTIDPGCESPSRCTSKTYSGLVHHNKIYLVSVSQCMVYDCMNNKWKIYGYEAFCRYLQPVAHSGRILALYTTDQYGRGVSMACMKHDDRSVSWVPEDIDVTKPVPLKHDMIFGIQF